MEKKTEIKKMCFHFIPNKLSSKAFSKINPPLPSGINTPWRIHNLDKFAPSNTNLFVGGRGLQKRMQHYSKRGESKKIIVTCVLTNSGIYRKEKCVLNGAIMKKAFRGVSLVCTWNAGLTAFVKIVCWGCKEYGYR